MEKQKIKLSNNKYTYLYKWKVSNPKKIIHLVHGSIEHIGRYEEMIKYFNKQKISVYGMDLRGHGQSAFEQKMVGNFDSYKWAYEDLEVINKIICKENKDKGIVMYGHSMGSFILRYYMLFNKGHDVILSGTNYQSWFLSSFGIFVARMAIIFKGKNKINKLINKLSYKSFDKKMPKGKSWLTNNINILEKYKLDELNGFKFTNEAFLNMFKWLKEINKRKSFTKYHGRILISSGELDPVGDFTKGPKKVYKKFSNSGSHVGIKIWDNGHHEIHNDKGKEKVYKRYSDFILNTY